MRVAPWVSGALVLSMAFGGCTCRSCGRGPEEEQTAMRPAATKRVAGFDPNLKKRREVELPREVAEAPTALPTPPVTLAPAVPEPVDLPDDFPADVPLPEKDARPFAVHSMAQNGKGVLFHSDRTAEQIFAQYQDEMPRNGWKKEQEYSTPHQSFLQFVKDKKNMQMTISTDPKTGKRVVQIMYHDIEDLPFPEF